MRCEDIAALALQGSGAPLTRLVRGEPDGAVIAALRGATAASLLSPARVTDPRAGQAVLAGLHLAGDDFERAHELAQGIPSFLGSWWHAILHRREPDAANSGYWYQKVKAPPALSEAIAAAALDRIAAAPEGLDPLAEAIRRSGRWEPLVFVDACERAGRDRASTARVAALAGVQAAEWRLLLEFSVDAATGKAG